ncbi:MAG: histidine kinase [Prevotella sp.]|nr:histidine kinase [Prevotella sp.]
MMSKRYIWLGFIGSLMMVYPNLVYIPWHMEWPCVQAHLWLYWSWHVVRFLYFAVLIMVIYRLNVVKGWTSGRRLAVSIAVSVVTYGLFAFVSFKLSKYGVYDKLSSMLILQFVVICSLGMLTGRISQLREEREQMTSEVERLRTENLQSQCAALVSQVNPHFFFNSLSGIASLVRGGDNTRTLEYIDELSDVFRYTLQSSDKGMVPLGDELDFANSFRYVLEMRYAAKLHFDIRIGNQQKFQYTLPVLTLLPVIDNVIVHNCIDSAHLMAVSISINENEELVVSNPLYPKQQQPVTNGTGLRNLANRMELMCSRKLRVDDNGDRFTVYIPLKG